MHYQPSTQSAKVSTRRRLARELQPGHGFDDLFIGQSEGHVVELWGEPEKREHLRDSSYLIYRKLGVEVELQEGKVYRLFFFTPKGAKGETTVSVNGLSFGATKRQVTQQFGSPLERGGGRVLSNGKYFREWFLFSPGVQFEFGKSGKMELITIFDPGSDVLK